MSPREAALAIARQLRSHLEWLGEQGLVGLPEGCVAPSVGGAEGPLRAASGAPPGSEVAPALRPAAAREARPDQMALLPPPLTVCPEEVDLGAQRPLSVIREELGDCTRCKLHRSRTHIVFGVGNPQADLMFVGEGPGREEDLQGEPFVGAAGQLLNRIIRAMGLKREEVYIANVVKCRPPENRDPEADEVASCSPFLFQQIASIRPKVIVGLGRPACATLLGAPLTTPITRIRGRWLKFRGQIP
jgi:uracil-DNA glycosylase family 4